MKNKAIIFSSIFLFLFGCNEKINWKSEAQKFVDAHKNQNLEKYLGYSVTYDRNKFYVSYCPNMEDSLETDTGMIASIIRIVICLDKKDCKALKGVIKDTLTDREEAAIHKYFKVPIAE